MTDAVHARDGKIALQLWHFCRISPHTSLPPDEQAPAASGVLRANANPSPPRDS
ncbi:hypothetical protein [Stenotrophomonas sp.]|uniref:hypothetical protein n=1 Tax=Stenotrophomonas sp. TaxID=69392 RepID=UPI0029B2E0C4|nr:hypothetical protein [Stenotrophomonas sp.]MDX3934124.1 hypothetical protein [Stenotrophomonas sp.]